MRQFLIAAFVLFSTVFSFAQHLIKGKVTDGNGIPLQGASVFIKSENAGKITDKEGVFIFDGLTKLRYTIEISYVGFEQAVIQATTDREVIIKLSHKSFNINEITVTSLRANNRSAVAYSDVQKEEIEQRNLGQDIRYF